MNNSKVRINSFELLNIKNVNYGKITVNSKRIANNSDILGMYGQNGSGKTTVVDAFKILKDMMEGNQLPQETVNYISANEDTMKLCFDFSINDNKNFDVVYEFSIANNNNFPVIIEEKLTYKESSLSGHSKKTITYSSVSEDNWLTPKIIARQLGVDKTTDLIVAKKISEKEHKSFFFNEEVAMCFKDNLEDVTDILCTLHNFACTDLFVIQSSDSNITWLNLFVPFFVKYKKNNDLCFGAIPMPINSVAEIDKRHYEDLIPVIEIINPVLNSMIPGLSIDIENYGEQRNELGNIIVKVDLVSKKEEKVIPFRYESDGIKKIVSILVLLIAMYNESSMCIVIDELDAGVFEYLLGEILTVLKDGGKGQLIFTSHNLRPLEVLKKDNIVFTTTNPNQRYIEFTNIGSTNNLRDLYIRTLNLGGQKEEVYRPISLSKMGMAFRKAKRGILDEEEKINNSNCRRDL